MTSSETLVRVENVSKKFCRSLKRSLWYGVQDIASELNPFGEKNGKRKAESRKQSNELVSSSLPLAARSVATGKAEIGKAGIGDSFQLSAFNSQLSDEPRLRRDEFWAVRDVSFELKRGECLGLIGHNGAGKSTLLKMLNGIIKPDTGRIEMRGRICAMIELGAGFNPILTGRENIYNRGAVLGFSKKEIIAKYDEIVDFADIGDFLEMPVQNYSSGMRVRLGFAVSALMSPDVLIIDEVLAVGDMGFIIKCLNRMSELIPHSAVIFVSHSMPMVSRISTQAILMENGRKTYFGNDVPYAIEQYIHRFETGKLERQVAGSIELEKIEFVSGSLESLGNSGMVIHQNGDDMELLLTLRNTTEHSLIISAFLIILDQQLREAVNCLSHENCSPWHLGAFRQLKLNVRISRLYLNRGKHSITAGASDPVMGQIYCRTTNAISFMVRSRVQGWGTSVMPGEWTELREEIA